MKNKSVLASNIVGTSEVAQLLNCNKPIIRNSHMRNPKFPRPIAKLACGPIWDKTEIEEFIKTRSDKMGKLIVSLHKLDITSFTSTKPASIVWALYKAHRQNKITTEQMEQILNQYDLIDLYKNIVK
ncbi:hypothetical protein D3C78_19000 [compost metagenome]